jgi:hypothetical protein
MSKWKAGDAVTYGYRIPGGIETGNSGVIAPFGGGLTLYIVSDLDCKIHAFRRLPNGEYILATEKRDDPKQRLWMRKKPKSEIDENWDLFWMTQKPNDNIVHKLWREYCH